MNEMKTRRIFSGSDEWAEYWGYIALSTAQEIRFAKAGAAEAAGTDAAAETEAGAREIIKNNLKHAGRLLSAIEYDGKGRYYIDAPAPVPVPDP